jgi:hypothetical protein
MAGSGRSVGDVLRSARQTFEFARLGQQDFNEGGSRRRLSGLHNAVTSGRSVTFVLQGLGNKVGGAADWYADVQERLKADPVCRWFVQVRNDIEKQGTAGATSSFASFSGSLAALHRQAPPNTTLTFVADNLGRSGWEVELADGTTHTVYFQLPERLGRVEMFVQDAPGGRPVAELLEHYLSTLESVVVEAEQKFGA